MKLAIFSCTMLISLFFSCCNEKDSRKASVLYFNPGELSDDFWADSLMNQRWSNELFMFNEPVLRDTAKENETIRLTVFPSFSNTYSIRLEKFDSLFVIHFNMGADSSRWRLSGLNGLSMTYKSDFWKMNTICNELYDAIGQFDIFGHDNATPRIVLEKGAVGADGIDYLLEYNRNGLYIALVRWNGFLENNYYEKSAEFELILEKMNSLVPDGLLPDLRSAKQIEDYRFPIFRDSLNDSSK